ncbi:MAG: hypothetical protein ACYTBZ_02685, partial [Planctomycetota bacterium]
MSKTIGEKQMRKASIAMVALMAFSGMSYAQQIHVQESGTAASTINLDPTVTTTITVEVILDNNSGQGLDGVQYSLSADLNSGGTQSGDADWAYNATPFTNGNIFTIDEYYGVGTEGD